MDSFYLSRAILKFGLENKSVFGFISFFMFVAMSLYFCFMGSVIYERGSLFLTRSKDKLHHIWKTID